MNRISAYTFNLYIKDTFPGFPLVPFIYRFDYIVYSYNELQFVFMILINKNCQQEWREDI